MIYLHSLGPTQMIPQHLQPGTSTPHALQPSSTGLRRGEENIFSSIFWGSLEGPSEIRLTKDRSREKQTRLLACTVCIYSTGSRKTWVTTGVVRILRLISILTKEQFICIEVTRQGKGLSIFRDSKLWEGNFIGETHRIKIAYAGPSWCSLSIFLMAMNLSRKRRFMAVPIFRSFCF